MLTKRVFGLSIVCSSFVMFSCSGESSPREGESFGPSQSVVDMPECPKVEIIGPASPIEAKRGSQISCKVALSFAGSAVLPNAVNAFAVSERGSRTAIGLLNTDVYLKGKYYYDGYLDVPLKDGKYVIEIQLLYAIKVANDAGVNRQTATKHVFCKQAGPTLKVVSR